MNGESRALTTGSVVKGMLLFAVPIFMSNLFQQLYNAVDSLIVGNFIGGEALAAVGSSGSLIFLLTGFVNGVSLGAGVLIARPGTTPRCTARCTPPSRWAWRPARC